MEVKKLEKDLPKILTSKLGKKYFIVNGHNIFIDSKLSRRELKHIYRLLKKHLPLKHKGDKKVKLTTKSLFGGPGRRGRQGNKGSFYQKFAPISGVINDKKEKELLDKLKKAEDDLQKEKDLRNPPIAPPGPNALILRAPDPLAAELELNEIKNSTQYKMANVLADEEFRHYQYHGPKNIDKNKHIYDSIFRRHGIPYKFPDEIVPPNVSSGPSFYNRPLLKPEDRRPSTSSHRSIFDQPSREPSDVKHNPEDVYDPDKLDEHVIAGPIVSKPMVELENRPQVDLAQQQREETLARQRNAIARHEEALAKDEPYVLSKEMFIAPEDQPLDSDQEADEELNKEYYMKEFGLTEDQYNQERGEKDNEHLFGYHTKEEEEEIRRAIMETDRMARERKQREFERQTEARRQQAKDNIAKMITKPYIQQASSSSEASSSPPLPIPQIDLPLFEGFDMGRLMPEEPESKKPPESRPASAALDVLPIKFNPKKADYKVLSQVARKLREGHKQNLKLPPNEARQGNYRQDFIYFLDKYRIPQQDIDRAYAEVKLGKGKGSNKDEALYNDQIDKVMDKYPEFKGCIMRDEIPKLLPYVRPKSRICFIINTDRSDKEGEHWQAILIDARPEGSNSLEFFDSFGRSIPKDVLESCKDLIKVLKPNSVLKVKENRVIQQSDDSENCGWFCIRFLIDRIGRNKSFSEATGYNDQLKVNHIKKDEKEIEKMKNMPKFRYI